VFSLFPSILGDYFGTKWATSNYGVLYSAKGVAAIIGPGLGTLMYEQTSTWNACLYGSTAFALGAAIIAFGLRAAAAPSRAAVGVPATAK
jgi:OFA family oxalate/formate antiporter-like MFS transporter